MVSNICYARSLFLSQLHLEKDARERVVMTEAYFAMSQRGFLTKAESELLVLNALFRQAGDGIVKDEGVGLSLPDLVANLPKASAKPG